MKISILPCLQPQLDIPEKALLFDSVDSVNRAQITLYKVHTRVQAVEIPFDMGKKISLCTQA